MEYGVKVGQKQPTDEEMQNELMNRIKFGKLIRERRKAKGMTSEELGKKLNVSGNYVNLVERGEKSCSDGFVREAAKVLGFDEGELFEILDRTPLSVKELVEENRELRRLLYKLSKAKLNDEQLKTLINSFEAIIDIIDK